MCKVKLYKIVLSQTRRSMTFGQSNSQAQFDNYVFDQTQIDFHESICIC